MIYFELMSQEGTSNVMLIHFEDLIGCVYEECHVNGYSGLRHTC